ncbi:D-inositol-3-phosphate glycosyltransferase [Sphingobacterium spiritivorum]|uniref:D-inositol-3-phosphate glycosyltransferase n=1 Tax=Sphingobacterium spiritivorum TaxID=258 RepID=A0A380B8P5_SPHSI|nr:glycosyltransferase family 1 protein [Sphingobacterium spiritivorum]SUI96875.1 D-inositol-3-phosphate glycosyltransferase [Sphingobacterium spiritivorum]
MDKKIIFDTERMKYEHTGLYHFCLHLGQALDQYMPKSDRLFFYQNPKTSLVFGDKANYLKQLSFHKFIKPNYSKYDIWHATFQLSSYIPKTRKPKVLLTIHDLNFIAEGKSESKSKKYLKKIQHNIDLSSEIVAISEYVKNDIETHCRLDGKKVTVIYNGSNIDITKVKSKVFKNPLETPFLFTIGTINRKKNFHVLPYLLLGNDYKLVISGIVHEENYRIKILEIAKSIGVDERVIFTGPISEDQKYAYLEYCSLFVFPSIAEGFGLPVIEAMTFGKKVLLSRYTCLPEIGGNEAFYLESTSADYMEAYGRNFLQKLIEQPTRESEIKAWASQFSWKKAAEKYLSIYESMLK